VTAEFDREVLAPVRRFLGRPVRLPDVGEWEVSRSGGLTQLRLRIGADQLSQNLQKNSAAAPYFLVCLGYWLARVSGADPALHVEVVGAPPAPGTPLQHYRRAWMALEALQQGLGDRFTIVGAPAQLWPSSPRLNAPVEKRGLEVGRGGREHAVEVQLCAEPRWAREFSVIAESINSFERQLPLGLFDGPVARSNHWTPGGAAQADLWAVSPDRETFHLVELKVEGNASVGVLPELLGYLWLLHRARHGLPDGTQLDGGGRGIDAAREAERLLGWIVAPRLHPLLLGEQGSPLEWVAEGLRGKIALGVLPYVEEPRGRFQRWSASGLHRF
jgi:hypothetical protein